MITLYHSKDTRSLRVVWLLEELEIDYDLQLVEFPPRRKDPGYLEVNPAGTVPYLVDGTVTLSESCAMLQYLSNRYGKGALSLPVDHPRYGDYLNFLHFGEASLTYPQAVVLRYRFFMPKEARLPQVAEDYQQVVNAHLPMLAHALGDGPYLCGEAFTLADISVGYGLYMMGMFKLDKLLSPPLQAYLARLMERPGFIRARGR